MTIRNDATRIRIATNDKRRPRAVVARQGQVLLDTDVDQQSRHQLDRIEIETVDTLGSPGRLLVPAGNDGFKATPNGTPPTNVAIAAGHGYLGGWLLENPTAWKLDTQPHPRTGDTLTAPVVVGLKALIRHIDPVEEPVLADLALGDAQASGRSLDDWQVFPLALPGASVDCSTVAANATWQALVAPSTGTLTVIEQTAPPSNDPCSLTPGGGYTRLENLLYRLEVDGGDAIATLPTIDGPRFGGNNLRLKLSRRNASVLARIAKINGNEIEVTPPALDPRNWFGPGGYAEVVSVHDDVDPRSALAATRLFRVALATDDRITLQATAAQVSATGATNDGTWFLRLWDAFPNGDGFAKATFAGSANDSAEIDLGDGLLCKVGKGGLGAGATFRRGDFWTFAARADGSIDWLKVGTTAQAMTPHGPEVRYAPLAVFDPAQPTPVEDCRIPFATLSDRTLLYRGGDGQSVFPTPGGNPVELPAKLRVAVMRGETPVVGAKVQWKFVGPAGGSCQIDGTTCNAATTVERATGADGLVEVPWAIDPAALLDTHQVAASLDSTGPAGAPAIVFTATFDVAEHVGYLAPDDACEPYGAVTNVAAALDDLIKFACNPPTGDGGLGCCHTVGFVGDRRAEFGDILEAIKALRGQGHKVICLCLLPGGYELNPKDLKDLIDGLDELVISGRGAQIVVPDRLEFVDLQRIALRDITIATKSAQALVFAGSGKAEGPRLDVELTDVTVRADKADPGRPLVTFADCRRTRITGCELHTSPSPSLHDLMPARLVAMVEMAETTDPQRVLANFAAMSTAAPNVRQTLATEFERSIRLNSDLVSDQERAVLKHSLEILVSDAAPTAPGIKRLMADWRRLGQSFGNRTAGWPVAIAFDPAGEGIVGADVEVVIEGCRISGGVMLGGPDRNVDAEFGKDRSAETSFEQTAGKPGIVPEGSGRMRLDGNILGWLAIGRVQAEMLAETAGDVAGAMKGVLFGEMQVTRNTFTSAPHSVVAGAATVHGNVFEQSRATGDVRWRVGFVSTMAVSATGNSGPALADQRFAQLTIRGDPGMNDDPGAATQAANSRLFVHVAGT